MYFVVYEIKFLAVAGKNVAVASADVSFFFFCTQVLYLSITLCSFSSTHVLTHVYFTNTSFTLINHIFLII